MTSLLRSPTAKRIFTTTTRSKPLTAFLQLKPTHNFIKMASSQAGKGGKFEANIPPQSQKLPG